MGTDLGGRLFTQPAALAGTLRRPDSRRRVCPGLPPRIAGAVRAVEARRCAATAPPATPDRRDRRPGSWARPDIHRTSMLDRLIFRSQPTAGP